MLAVYSYTYKSVAIGLKYIAIAIANCSLNVRIIYIVSHTKYQWCISLQAGKMADNCSYIHEVWEQIPSTSDVVDNLSALTQTEHPLLGIPC